MAKTLVNLTLGEAKTKVDLTLEQKKVTTIWGDAGTGAGSGEKTGTGTEDWGETTRTWFQPGEFNTKETKTKVDLILE